MSQNAIYKDDTSEFMVVLKLGTASPDTIREVHLAEDAPYERESFGVIRCVIDDPSPEELWFVLDCRYVSEWSDCEHDGFATRHKAMEYAEEIGDEYAFADDLKMGEEVPLAVIYHVNLE